MTDHSASCGGKCILIDDTKVCGFTSVLCFKCIKCSHCFKVKSSQKVKRNDGTVKWAVNLAAVLGQISTGGGHSRLNQTLATMAVPGVKKKLYSQTEKYLGDEMKQQLVKCMADNAEHEKNHAIEIDSFHQRIPAIKVIVDGGWSKRTHKHSYNAMSGVAVIFGHYTKKLLFLSVRNKFCSICAIHDNKNADPPTCRCYKNWNGSSSAMETDIICEGYRMSETLYNIRYMFVIGDADS
uniref:Mutator-like transposase domain-containing protein n=1 Tax=Amphimedon queenslandica TaxID=400682 RepID=A0A1X7U5M3_AMPQE